MVTALLLLALGGCPEGCVGTATAAAYREAWIVWEQRARDERSAHETTRAELAVCRARVDEAKTATELARAEGISRSSRTWLAVGAALAGAGAGMAGIGVALDDPARQPVVLGGVGAVLAGVLVGAVTLVVEP